MIIYIHIPNFIKIVFRIYGVIKLQTNIETFSFIILVNISSNISIIDYKKKQPSACSTLYFTVVPP